MKKTVLFLAFLMWVSFIFAEVKNPDKPLKGTWDFKLRKVWNIDMAGKHPIAGAAGILVSEEENVYVHDRKAMRYYIFNKDGQFIKAFGKRGEGPGSIKNIRGGARFHLVDNMIAIIDLTTIHYFTKNGEYIRTVRTRNFEEGTTIFLNQNEIIFVPSSLPGKPGNKIKISRTNLKTGKKSIITEHTFSRPAVPTVKGRRMVIKGMPGLVPGMIMGYYKNTIYYGINHSYIIHVTDLKGKKVNTFLLEREKKKIPMEEKRKSYQKPPQMPSNLFKLYLKNIPDSPLCFTRIEGHNGLIYVFAGAINNNRIREQQIDIFSRDGKFLYTSYITFASDTAMVEPLFTMVIKKDHVYAYLEDEDGRLEVVKYKIVLPKP